MKTPPPLALAGPAEMAIFSSYAIHGAALFICAVLAIVSWKRRGWLSALIALLLLAGTGVLLEVQDLFSHVSSTDDPDSQHWDRIWRFLCVIWILLTALALLCLGRTLIARPKLGETP